MVSARYEVFLDRAGGEWAWGCCVVVADWLEAQKFRFDVGGIGDFYTMHEHRRAVVDPMFLSWCDHAQVYFTL